MPPSLPDLREFSRDLVDGLGIADPGGFAGAPAGSRPRDLLPECASVVVFTLKHLSVFATSTDLSCQAYTQDLVNHELHQCAYRIARYIERQGGRAFPIVASVEMWPFGRPRTDVHGRISLRHAAQLAGLGRIGRSALLITPEFGPRVQLGAILTDVPFAADAPAMDGPCTDCGRCVAVCPAGAIGEPPVGEAYVPVDQERCTAFRRQHGGVSPLGFRQQCALCRAVCPVGAGLNRARQPTRHMQETR